nr:unnamed protein product [Callosobruchus analis]
MSRTFDKRSRTADMASKQSNASPN